MYCESGPAVPFLSMSSSSYLLVNTHKEWFHWYRQETIHCFHVFTENIDKLQAMTFTHGRERDVKQASHTAAAACLRDCTHVCIKVSETDHAISLVHISPCTPCAIADLFHYLVKP